MDATEFPILVHNLQSAAAFGLAQKVWQSNARSAMPDPANGKDRMRFAFANPECVVWLQRDQGRQDSFELILMWGATVASGMAEVYVLANAVGVPVGDDSRANNLLQGILASPAVTPVIT
jgi:hypothetical protein